MHTPGPWIADWVHGLVRERGGSHIARMPSFTQGSEYGEANCNLIAAAPELLKTLEEITDHFADVMSGPMITGQGVQFQNGVEGIPTIKAARDAISKAKGEAT